MERADSPAKPANSPAKPSNSTAKKVVNEKDENQNTSSLHLECEDEPLSVSQKNFHKEKLKNFNEQMKKLEELAKKGAQIQNKGTVIQNLKFHSDVIGENLDLFILLSTTVCFLWYVDVSNMQDHFLKSGVRSLNCQIIY